MLVPRVKPVGMEPITTEHRNKRFLQALILSPLGFLTGFLLTATSLQAAVMENILPLNAKAFGLGNAVTADYVGIDSLQYNPAALVNLKAGYSIEFKAVGAPLIHAYRKNSPTLTPDHPEFNLFYGGYTVRCDSPFRPFTDIQTPNANPGRNPLSGTPDTAISNNGPELATEVCVGPELVNPNGVFYDDPLDSAPNTIDVLVPIPIILPLYIPNIGYKQSPDSRLAFAAQFFTNLAVPTINLGDKVDSVKAVGIQRVTFSPGLAFRVTDTLSVGAAFRISQSRVQLDVYLDGQNQFFGFLNAGINDLCATNEARRNKGAAFVYEDLLNCVGLFQTHQERVDDGLARESGYWPFLPWDSIAEIQAIGKTPFVYGYNLGVQWTPIPWLTWGATYRSKEVDKYTAGGDIFYSRGVQNIFTAFQGVPILNDISSFLLLDGSASDSFEASIEIPWPAAVSTGISAHLTEKIKVNLEYRKYMYSAWKTWDLNITKTELAAIKLLQLLDPESPNGTIPLPVGGVDTSYYTYGFEYQWNQRLAYRFGYEDRPFLNDVTESVVPIYGVKIVSIGSEYKLTHNTVVDIAFSAIRLDGIAPKESTLNENPIELLTLRGAEYKQQLQLGMVLFTAGYRHQF